MKALPQDYRLLHEMMEYDSCSGNEREFALFLQRSLKAGDCRVMEVGDGTLNLLFSWGEPRLVFCTHMDTVPPYIAPGFDGERIFGRGSCDAKGQIYSMYRACETLAAEGCAGFGLLLLSGEETGSFGAKAFAKTDFRGDYVVVGEPTGNRMVSASKGTKGFDLHFLGEAFHSGYPEYGRSAVEMFVDFMEKLRSQHFTPDAELGDCSWNVGLLHSDNPRNVLSPALDCSIFFRTCFDNDAEVVRFMQSQRSANLEIGERGGDAPLRYYVPEGFESCTVSFGSDAPHLANFARKSICGPGSIRLAHRDDESVSLSELDEAIEIYRKIYYASYN